MGVTVELSDYDVTEPIDQSFVVIAPVSEGENVAWRDMPDQEYLLSVALGCVQGVVQPRNLVVRILRVLREVPVHCVIICREQLHNTQSRVKMQHAIVSMLAKSFVRFRSEVIAPNFCHLAWNPVVDSLPYIIHVARELFVVANAWVNRPTIVKCPRDVVLKQPLVNELVLVSVQPHLVVKHVARPDDEVRIVLLNRVVECAMRCVHRNVTLSNMPPEACTVLFRRAHPILFSTAYWKIAV